MSKRTDRIISYLNETGHVKGLRQRLREKLDAHQALECELALDAIMERAIELASSPDWPAERKA